MKIQTRAAPALATAGLLIGLVLTINGLLAQTWPQVLPWINANEFYRYTRILTVISIWFALAMFRFRWTLMRTLGSTAITVIILAGQLFSLLAVAAFTLTAITLGQRIARMLGIGSPANPAGQIEAFLLGAGCMGTLIGLLGKLPIHTPGLYALLLCIGTWSARADIGRAWQAWRKSAEGVEASPWQRGLDALIGTLLIVHLLMSLQPELGFDALAMHLAIPDYLAKHASWHADPTYYAWALMPMLANWIISVPYMLTGETGAKLLNHAFTYVLLLQCHAMVRWCGGSATTSRLACLLLLTTPLVLGMNCSMQVEFIWTAMLLGAVIRLLAVQAQASDLRADLSWAAMLTGLAVAAKAVCLALLPLMALIAIVRPFIRKDAWRIRDMLLAIGLFLLLSGYPYVHAWLITGNPVFPFFNSYFRSPLYPAHDFNNVLYQTPLNWRTPYDLNFLPNHFMESTVGGGGFHWILLPVAMIIGLLKRNVRLLLLSASLVLCLWLIFRSQSYLRYAFPALAWLAVVLAVAIGATAEQASRGWRTAMYGAFAAFLALNMAFITSATWTYRHMPLSNLFSDHQRAQYLDHVQPGRRAIDALNALNKDQTPIAYFSAQTMVAGLNAPALIPSWYNPPFAEDVQAWRTAEQVTVTLGTWKSQWIILDDTWGTAAQRELIASVSAELVRFKHLSIRRLQDSRPPPK